jgi:hypothetical protein
MKPPPWKSTNTRGSSAATSSGAILKTTKPRVPLGLGPDHAHRQHRLGLGLTEVGTGMSRAAGTRGSRLAEQGIALVSPVASPLLGYGDSVYVSDIEQIFGNLAYGLIARFTEGQIAITEILPVLERTVFRLMPHPERSSR